MPAHAAKTVAEPALDVIPGTVRGHLSIEVFDVQSPALIAMREFEAVVLR